MTHVPLEAGTIDCCPSMETASPPTHLELSEPHIMSSSPPQVFCRQKLTSSSFVRKLEVLFKGLLEAVELFGVLKDTTCCLPDPLEGRWRQLAMVGATTSVAPQAYSWGMM